MHAPCRSYAGIDGCCNDDPTPSGSVGMTGVSASSSSNLPYMTVLACNTTGAAPGDAPVLPPGALLLSSTGACPPGWNPLNDTVGACVVPEIALV